MEMRRQIDIQRNAWKVKPTLQAVYADYYRRIRSECLPGATLEIGGGSGHSRGHIPDVITIDIQMAPWLDAVADAHVLPFADGSFANIVMLDVLHHLSMPAIFLAEAERVLESGGRLVIIEPEITPLSRLIFALFHHEPVDLSADPFSGLPQSGRAPEESNQAIPHLMFRRYRGQLRGRFSGLRLLTLQRLSLLAYPLSGGFQRWCLLPRMLVAPVLRLEALLLPVVGWLAAFRLLAVMEKVREK